MPGKNARRKARAEKKGGKKALDAGPEPSASAAAPVVPVGAAAAPGAAVDEVELTDDWSSAWQEAKETGRAWGGRGFGGRGIQLSMGNTRDVMVEGVTLSYFGKQILNRTKLRLMDGHRYGLVGRNGVGKTTLMRRMASGSLPGFPRMLSVLLIEQEMQTEGEDTVLDAVMKADNEKADINGQREKVLQRLSKAKNFNRESYENFRRSSTGPASACTPPVKTRGATTGGAGGDKLKAKADGDTSTGRAQTQENVNEEDEADLPSLEEIEALTARLAELDLELDYLSGKQRQLEALDVVKKIKMKPDKKMKELSGGQRKKVKLAQALMLKPDVLLLDEPTNHLDLATVLWLEDFLNEFESTMIIVSHDRNFLNSVVTDIVEFRNQELNYFPGDLDNFEKTKEDQMKKMLGIQQALDKKREHVEQSIKNMHKAMHKNSKDQKRGAQIASRKKKLDRMGYEKNEHGHRWRAQYAPGLGIRAGATNENAFGFDKNRKMTRRSLVDPGDKDIVFTFQSPEDALGTVGDLVQFRNVSFSYPGAAAPLFSSFDFSIQETDKVVVLGRNGTGKSTLIRLLCGDLELKGTQGEVWKHHSLRMAYFAQNHLEKLDTSLSALAHMQQLFPDEREQTLRGQLSGMGLPSALATQEMFRLSGGQKCRVVLAAATFNRPHLLVLDEPTNHLDFDSIEGLIVALQNYKGAVVLVTHDQYLAEEVGEVFLAIYKKKIERLEGGVDEYITKCIQKR